jgi:hypothetical protein
MISKKAPPIEHRRGRVGGEETPHILPILGTGSLTSVKSAVDFYDFFSQRG